MIDYTDAGRFGFAAQQKLTYEGPPVPVSKDQATRLGAVRSPLQSWDEMAAYSTCVFPFLRDVSFPSALPVRFRASHQNKRFPVSVSLEKTGLYGVSVPGSRAVSTPAAPFCETGVSSFGGSFPGIDLPLGVRGFFLEQTDDFYRQFELALKRH